MEARHGMVLGMQVVCIFLTSSCEETRGGTFDIESLVWVFMGACTRMVPAQSDTRFHSPKAVYSLKAAWSCTCPRIPASFTIRRLALL